MNKALHLKLSEKQTAGLLLAFRAKKIAFGGYLICAYGNEFFMAGRTFDDGTAERNTLMSLKKKGLLSWRPGFALRGEFTITDVGLEIGNLLGFTVEHKENQ